MKSVTLGQLIVEVARGQEKERQLSAEQIQDLRRSIADKIAPKIEEIRTEQRRAFEDAKTVVLK